MLYSALWYNSLRLVTRPLRVAFCSRTLQIEISIQIVEAKMHEHYDSFVDEDPEVQERVARGKIQIAQKMVVGLVEERFPSLTELAQEKATLIRNTDALDQLSKQVATVPDENTASWLLNTFSA